MAFIEGRNAVREALWAGMPLRRVLLAENAQPDRTIDDIVRLAEKNGVPVERVNKREIDKVSERGAHQGRRRRGRALPRTRFSTPCSPTPAQSHTR